MFKGGYEVRSMIMAIFILISVIFISLVVSVNVFGYEYTDEDIKLIARITQHEAGNQSELGQRLVIDTILNRLDSDEFPNTVADVINQPGQYCNPKQKPPIYIYKLIEDEIRVRTNDKVLWFRKYKYHPYGTPIIQEGDHYFSGGM